MYITTQNYVLEDQTITPYILNSSETVFNGPLKTTTVNLGYGV